MVTVTEASTQLVRTGSAGARLGLALAGGQHRHPGDQQLLGHGSGVRHPGPAPPGHCGQPGILDTWLLPVSQTRGGHVLHWPVQPEQSHVIVGLGLHIAIGSGVQGIGEVGVDGDLGGVIGPHRGRLQVLMIVLTQKNLGHTK